MPYHRSAAGYDLLLTEEPLSLDGAFKCLQDEVIGGITLFIGTVRRVNEGRVVVRLDYEAQATLALNELEKIAKAMLERWDLLRVVMHHRVGTLEVGEIAVIVGAAAAHRRDSFDACRYGIDTLKERVPIWKKEYFEGGVHWIADPAHDESPGQST